MAEFSYKRADKIAHLLQHELAAYITHELNDPRVGFVTITEVRLSDDLRLAKVYVSVYGTEEQCEQTITALNESKRFLRKEVVSRIQLRYAPDILFLRDATLAHAGRLEQIFSEISGKEIQQDVSVIVPVATDRTALAEKVQFFKDEPQPKKPVRRRSKYRR